MSKFKVGDKVRCITHSQEPYFTKGEEILIEGIQCDSIYGRGEFRYDSSSWYIHFDQIELVEASSQPEKSDTKVEVNKTITVTILDDEYVFEEEDVKKLIKQLEKALKV